MARAGGAAGRPAVPRAAPDPGPARRRGAAVAAGRIPVPVVPRHRVPGRARRRHEPARPARRHGGVRPAATATSCWSATTRSTAPGRRSATPPTAYDPMAQGGTTTVEVTRTGEVVGAFTSLNGTQMNCSGGPMPWGSWITCEETVNGPDVGPDFTGVSNVPLTKPHGFIFEVPAGGQSDRRADHRGRPVRPRGRGVRPARRRPLPDRGQLRLPLRLLPLPPAAQPDAHRPARQRRPAADAGGQGPPERSTSAAEQPQRATYRVEWVDIDDPAPDASRTRRARPRRPPTTRR